MQGFNMGRYRPPNSLDPSLGTEIDNQRAVKARKTNSSSSPSGDAQQTVRFEMPFAIWCSTCPKTSTSQLIGQGVRFNAIKKRVATFMSTPVWSFRMKHTACGGWIEMRTDPKSEGFVVAERARKRDTGDDAVVAERSGGVLLRSEDEAQEDKMKQDALETLEGKKDQTFQVKADAKRVEELRSLKRRDWKDPDAANKKLRDSFRVGRKEREKDENKMEALKETMGLGMEILPENEEDKRRAGFVEFAGGRDKLANGKVDAESLAKLASDNTKAAQNPFGTEERVIRGFSKVGIPGIKRKKFKSGPKQEQSEMKDRTAHAVEKYRNPDGQTNAKVLQGNEGNLSTQKPLVDYGSDSD